VTVWPESEDEWLDDYAAFWWDETEDEEDYGEEAAYP
jgi:hypothetical protein